MRRYRASALLILACLTLSACGKPKGPPPPPTPSVSVATPLQGKVVDWDEFTGRFEAPFTVEVRARAGGYLQAAHFKDGQLVKKGQLLFTLDPRPAQAQFAAAKAQAELAQAELKRSQKLLAATAISREEYEGRRSAALVAEAAMRARALDVEFTRVTAPITGIVSYRRVDPGNVIAGGSSTGDILTTIVSANPIYFVFDASEAQLLRYQRQLVGRSGAPVKVRLQDETEARWSGQMDFLDNVVNGQSGAVRLRAVVANPGGFLKPGMFGAVRMAGTSAYPALLIPDTAVVSDGARKVAYVAGPGDKVVLKPLELGPAVDGLRVIRSGLTASDRVIVAGFQRAQPGMDVKTTVTRITRTASGFTPPAPDIAPSSTATLAP